MTTIPLKPHPDDFNRRFSLYTEIFNEESDRGVVIVSAAILDSCLGDLFKKYLADFPQGKKYKNIESEVFGPLGPLGSFSSRTKFALKLGLISQKLYEIFDTIRDIRNDCAHFTKKGELIKNPFNHRSIIDRIENISKPFKHIRSLHKQRDLEKIRNKFIHAVVVLIIHLLWMSENLKDIKRRDPEFFFVNEWANEWLKPKSE